MLSTMRSSWLLFALFALVALTAAFSVEDAFNMDGINAYLHHGIKRQAEGTQASSSEASSNTRRPSASASDNESTPTPETSTPSSPSSSTQQSSAEDSATPSASPSDLTSSPSRTTSSRPATTSSDDEKTTPSTSATSTPSARVSTKALVSTSQQAFTSYLTITETDGQTREIASTGTRAVEITTGTALSTLAPDSNNGDGGGLSSSNKAIIGGVIGGVGGAILLGGIAFVCWRMWGKKKRVSEDDADLMAGTGAALGDKGHGTPFQSNLEQYHNPGGRPNAAANF